MFYVYAITSRLADRTYIGQTQDVTVRIASHNRGDVRTTKQDGPWKLIAVEGFETREAPLVVRESSAEYFVEGE